MPQGSQILTPLPLGQGQVISERSTARAAGMSQSAVSRIWRAFDLEPHIVEAWKLSADAQFVTKVRDVVGVCLSPQQNALDRGGSRHGLACGIHLAGVPSVDRRHC